MTFSTKKIGKRFSAMRGVGTLSGKTRKLHSIWANNTQWPYFHHTHFLHTFTPFTFTVLPPALMVFFYWISTKVHTSTKYWGEHDICILLFLCYRHSLINLKITQEPIVTHHGCGIGGQNVVVGWSCRPSEVWLVIREGFYVSLPW